MPAEEPSDSTQLMRSQAVLARRKYTHIIPYVVVDARLCEAVLVLSVRTSGSLAATRVWRCGGGGPRQELLVGLVGGNGESTQVCGISSGRRHPLSFESGALSSLNLSLQLVHATLPADGQARDLGRRLQAPQLGQDGQREADSEAWSGRRLVLAVSDLVSDKELFTLSKNLADPLALSSKIACSLEGPACASCIAKVRMDEGGGGGGRRGGPPGVRVRVADCFRDAGSRRRMLVPESAMVVSENSDISREGGRR